MVHYPCARPRTIDRSCDTVADVSATQTSTATALDRLQQHYLHRYAAASDALARGIGVVGRIGPTVPSELVVASGRLPTLVAAELGSPTPNAEIFMEPVIPPETKSLFEIATGGSLQQFDLLVLSRRVRPAVLLPQGGVSPRPSSQTPAAAHARRHAESPRSRACL